MMVVFVQWGSKSDGGADGSVGGDTTPTSCESETEHAGNQLQSLQKNSECPI